MRRRRRESDSLGQIICLAGPKGGVGRSSVTVEMARSLALRDKRVLVVDLDVYGQGLSFLLGTPPLLLQDASEFTPSHSPLAHVACVLLSPNVSQIEALFDHVRKLYDFIIFDLRPDYSARDIMLFLNADIPVLISQGEESSLFAATQWIRHSVVSLLQSTPDNIDIMPSILPHQEMWQFVDIYQSLAPQLQAKFVNVLADFRCAFLLNGRREHSESMQSEALCHAWGMQLGVGVSYLGSIGYEERRWFFMRKHAPDTHVPHENSMAGDMDGIARRLCEGNVIKPSCCLPIIDVQTNPRSFLGAQAFDEARQNYRKLWEGYRREGGLVSCILTPDMIAQTVSLLENANRRAAIEAETNTESSQNPNKLAPKTEPIEITEVTRKLSGSFAAAVRHYDPESCQVGAGIWLAQAREKAQISIKMLSLRTRIPPKCIERIEAQDLEDIPPARLQAYLFEIAKALDIKLDEVRSQFGF